MMADILQRFRRLGQTLYRNAGETWRSRSDLLESISLDPPVHRADPVLHWLIFTGLSLFALVLLGFFGHLQRMVTGDKTFISLIIALLYFATSGHCLWRMRTISRETEAASRLVTQPFVDDRLEPASPIEAGPEMPLSQHGLIAAHVRDLAEKARLQGNGRLDQTLLLRALASRLRGSNQFGAFMGDTLMKLGLFGTIIGFIMMLAPIAGLDVDNQGAIKSSMAAMSDGMAVAMYTTLAGLAGALLLKIQYSLLDSATGRLFAFAVELTEVKIVPVLERQMGRAA
jgi:hypothetical protein